MAYGDEVLALFKLSAPERAAEFDALWLKFRPHFEKAPDQSGFILEANSWFIRSTDRTTLTIWLIGYALWAEMYCWSSFIFFLSKETRVLIPKDFDSWEGQAEAYAKADSLFSAAMAFLNAPVLDMALWPPVPKPRDILSASNEEQLVNDLVHHAVSFFYFHELRHFLLAKEGKVLEPIEEELECDRWAAEQLLGRSHDYRPAPGQPSQDSALVKSKRAMGVALGTAAIAHIQQLGLWETSQTHPAVATRFLALSSSLNLDKDDYYWNLACTFTLASLRRKGRLPTSIPFSDLRDLFQRLLEER